MPKGHRKPMKGSLGTAFIIEKVPAQRKLSCSKCSHYDSDGSCNKLAIVISEVGYDYFKFCKYFDRVDKRVKDKKKVIQQRDNREIGITINSIVQLYDCKYKEMVSYRLTEPNQSNPLEGKISISSPLGKELVGKRAGQKIQVHTPSGIDQYRIIGYK